MIEIMIIPVSLKSTTTPDKEQFVIRQFFWALTVLCLGFLLPVTGTEPESNDFAKKSLPLLMKHLLVGKVIPTGFVSKVVPLLPDAWMRGSRQ